MAMSWILIEFFMFLGLLTLKSTNLKEITNFLKKYFLKNRVAF